MSTIFDPILTDAGQAAAFLASNDGVELQLTHVSFGTAHYDPNGSEEALLAEVSGKLPIAGGSRPTVSQIRMTSVWRADTGTFAIGEVAFWAGEVLAFIWSKAAGDVVGYKTPGVDFVLFNDLSFTQVPAGSISIVIDPDASVALAALAAHEGADNAHPQYVRYDVFPAAQKNLWAKTVAGTANALVITMQDGVHVDAYENGLMIRFKAASQSTGIATVNIDGKGVVSIKKGGGQPLDPGDIRAGGIYELVFDTDHFELAGGVGGSGFMQKFPYIATAGQTVFTASYTPGSILVFQNGRELPDAGYVATDGLVITLNIGATLGDDLLIVAFTAFAVANTYAKGEADARYAPIVASTPSQFDNDQSYATTEFVQRALGNHKTVLGINASTALTAAAAGSFVSLFGGGAFSLTLPLGSTVPAGAKISFICITAPGQVFVQRQGADQITLSGSSVVTGFDLYSGDTLEVVWTGTSWAVAGSIQAKYQPGFGSSLAASGYQKLPSGLIIQWQSVGSIASGATTTFTRAVAFPNFLLAESITALGGSAGPVGSNGSTKTGISIRNDANVAVTSAYVIAIGS